MSVEPPAAISFMAALWFARWMGTGASIEPAPGGTVQVQYQQGQVATGRIAAFDPPRRISLTRGFEGRTVLFCQARL
jgi:uncharacterized protein YndB with AHSA1/START domain